MTAFVSARVAGGIVLVLSLFVAGCGGGPKPAGTVAGTVKYKGAPVTVGDVNFLSKTGAAAIAKIDATGQYKIDGALDAGEYKVYASPPEVEQAAPGTKAAAPRKFDLPVKFRDPNSSGVTVTVKSGSNDIAIEFKD